MFCLSQERSNKFLRHLSLATIRRRTEQSNISKASTSHTVASVLSRSSISLLSSTPSQSHII
jgi:hypothetical protein